MGNPIPTSAFSSSLQPNQQQDENKELAALAKSIHADSTEEDLYRLTELTVKWVIANPQPIKLKQANKNNKTRHEFHSKDITVQCKKETLGKPLVHSLTHR